MLIGIQKSSQNACGVLTQAQFPNLGTLAGQNTYTPTPAPTLHPVVPCSS